MPKTNNTAAKSTRAIASNRRKQLLTVGLVTIGLVIVISVLLSNSASLQIGGVGLLVLLFALRLIPDLFDGYSRRKVKTIRRADRGADAEEDIGSLLDSHPAWRWISARTSSNAQSQMRWKNVR